MTLSAFASIIKETYANSIPRAPSHDRRNQSDLAFAVWAAIALTGMAVLSVALGGAQSADPAMLFP